MTWLPEAVLDKAALLLQFTSALADHRLRPGDRLPNERRLAEESGLSRGAVRDTLAELERRGILTRHVGRGTYIAAAGAGDGPAALPALPDRSQGWPLTDCSPAELVGFRVVIEPAIVGLVSFAATNADLQRLADAVIAGREVRDWIGAEAADARFHGLLFDCTGNQMFRSLGQQILLLRSQRAWQMLKASSFSPEKWAHYQAEHEQINEAIQSRDAERATKLLRAHLTGVHRNTLPLSGDL
ncbi:FadR/GntR family transcriptional regulator [Pseudogemmobacter humi]|uniref:FadR/GntR family transcriptional regulator n=1 Tax=Pseudogemmobacter humi TaxID=2483812 RepID=UPI000F51F32C|nr:FCD domain-containing protein [Pseudogemmobacter humi]